MSCTVGDAPARVSASIATTANAVPRSRRVNTSSHVARTSTASAGGSSSVAPQAVARSCRGSRGPRCGRRAAPAHAAQHHPDLAVEHTWCGPRRDPVGRRRVEATEQVVGRLQLDDHRSHVLGTTGQPRSTPWHRARARRGRWRPTPSTVSGSRAGRGPGARAGLAGSRGPRCTSRRSRARSRAHQPFCVVRPPYACARDARRVWNSRRGVEGGGGHRDEQPAQVVVVELGAVVGHRVHEAERRRAPSRNSGVSVARSTSTQVSAYAPRTPDAAAVVVGERVRFLVVHRDDRSVEERKVDMSGDECVEGLVG